MFNERQRRSIMKNTDEIYIKLTDIYWNVLSENKDVARFKDEFFTTALEKGYTLDDISIYWGI